MADWVERYDRSDIDAREPPQNLCDRARVCATFVSSPLPRSVSSARRLAPDQAIEAESIFQEAALPSMRWPAPKLPPPVWAAVFRVAWFCGYSGEAESHREARVRAKLAAERLVELACLSGAVMLVGHGVMNRLIARQLRILGARGPKYSAGRHWKFTVYFL
jgi:broad specificity phosphatase PhoE